MIVMIYNIYLYLHIYFPCFYLNFKSSNFLCALLLLFCSLLSVLLYTFFNLGMVSISTLLLIFFSLYSKKIDSISVIFRKIRKEKWKEKQCVHMYSIRSKKMCLIPVSAILCVKDIFKLNLDYWIEYKITWHI